jgi:hypothetical protein
MKAKIFLRMVYFALSIVSLGLLPACVALQRAVPQPAPSGDQVTAPGAATPAEAATPEAAHKSYIAPVLNAESPIPDDWPAFESPELGIQFRFPSLPGEASYEYHNWPENAGDPSGTLAEWQVTRNDRHETYTFAAVESEDMRVGRERWFTDIIRWFYDENAQKYYVVYGGSKQPQVEVQPLRVVTRGDGLQGIIFTPDYLKGPGISAVLSLPDGFSPKIKVISFYFPDPVSLDDAALVLNSVAIKH